MVRILDGRALSVTLGRKLAQKIRGKKIRRSLVIFTCEPTDASQSYIAQKQVLAEQLGVSCIVVLLPMSTNAAIAKIRSTLSRKKPNGAIVQLPLPKKLDAAAVVNAIPVDQDVDALSSISLGLGMQKKKSFQPPIVRAVLYLLKQAPSVLRGAHVVLVGAGVLVGRPLLLELVASGATVTVCQKYTKNLSLLTRQGDIVISGTGSPHLLRAQDIKKGAIVLDAGFSRKNGKIVGDIHIPSVQKKASVLSPVPGGLGPLTVYFLFANLVEGINRK